MEPVVLENLGKAILKIEQLEKQLSKLRTESVVIVMDSNVELGNGIVSILHNSVKQTSTKIYRFGNNEINTFPTESVREKNVYIVGSGSNVNGTINDNIMAMCSMIRSCRDASAKHITLVCAYYPYARSDKKDVARAPIMGKLMADFFKSAGANRLITVDLHAGQIQGFFDNPFDNLYAIDYLIAAVKRDYDTKDIILVSPDAGGEKRVNAYSKKLNVECTFMTKSRDHTKVSVIVAQELVHKDIDLKGKVVIVVDDIFDTGSTMCNGAEILRKKGAAKVIAVVTHGIFSGKAFENLAKDDLDAIYVTNSLPQKDNMAKSNKIRVVDISKLFGDAILACVNHTSLSALFS